MRRRDFVAAAGVTGGLALGAGWVALRNGDTPSNKSTGSSPPSPGDVTRSTSPYGPLLPADDNGLHLPAGFSSRVIATSGEVVPGTGHTWHANPDGGAAFPTGDGGWIYVSNNESSDSLGGVGAVEFGPDGTIMGARTILEGTSRNCAGGATPWGTWLSCEEHPSGLVWECDPTGAQPGVARPALGAFFHEAAAVDHRNGVVYLTEDRPDGGLYRFVPDAYPDLSQGALQVLVESRGELSWVVVPDPGSIEPATKDQVPDTRRFNRGEGAWFHDGLLYFATTADNRVWILDPSAMELEILYDEGSATEAALSKADNVTVSDTAGEVFVAEDGGNMEICLLVSDGAVPFLRLTAVTGSEMTGPAFSPDGTRFYFSSQRNPGRTYEVTGPFRGTSRGN